ncbi:MAG: MBL fold metallo-hydrolase [Bacteroidales bacterium]|nr:MBL fold metallo-hydrolase [Bacteroidales bacterium]
MDIFRFVVNMFQENTMIVTGIQGRCVVVDPGFSSPQERGAVYGCLQEKGLKPEAVLITHGHTDHIGGAADLQRSFGIPVYMSDEDWPVIRYFQRAAKFGWPVADIDFKTTPVSDGQVIEAAGMSFRVITTPGHSPGGVCYYEQSQQALFTGDTLFAGSIGRTDLKDGDYDSLIVSVMEKLMSLPGTTEIYPGHGAPSTIGTEMSTNPFLEPFNEREEIPELNTSE